MHFRRPQGGCPVLAAKGGIKNGAESAVPRQRSDTIYLPRAGALNPPVRRSRSQAEPWQPRAKGPAAGSTLTPVRACQPSGIQESAAPPTGIYRHLNHLRFLPRSFALLRMTVDGGAPRSRSRSRPRPSGLVPNKFPQSQYLPSPLNFSPFDV